MDIVLSHLKVRDLLSCRKVSKFWNKAASFVLRKRSTMIKNIEGESDLTELQKCMKKSWDFPFAGLMFEYPQSCSSARITKFLKKYGKTFTSLRLGTPWQITVQEIIPFVNHLPRLAIFETCNDDVYSESPTGQEGCQILKLPSLRILRISFQLDEDFLRQVFTASSPSLRIECLEPFYRTLTALKSIAKLQALSVLKVVDQRSSYDALRVDELLSTGSPSLTELEFEAGGCISKTGLIHVKPYVKLEPFFY